MEIKEAFIILMITPESLEKQSKEQQLDSVKKAYRSLSKLYHPDRSASDSDLQDITNEAQKRLTGAKSLIIEYIKAGRPFTAPKSSSQSSYSQPPPNSSQGPSYNPPPPPPKPPPPEIVPGVWVNIPDHTDPTTQVGMMAAQLSGGMQSKNMYILAPGGEFVGQVFTQTFGAQTEIKVAGNWSYNTFQKALLLQGFSEVNMNVNLFGMNFGNMGVPRQPFHTVLQILQKVGPNKYLIRDQSTQMRSYFELQQAAP